MQSYEFNAGAAMVDITPPIGTILGGDFWPHYARFIHDPLYVKALVLEYNGFYVAIVIVDICIMGTDLIDDIKRRIQKQTGIDPKDILLASNHNHATANVVGLLGSALDIDYRLKLPDLVVKAVQQAKDKWRPAKIAAGKTDVPEYVLCRRYLMKEGYVTKNPVTHKNDQVKTNPFGLEHLIVGPAASPDGSLSFLAVKGMDEQWIALLENYSLHYVSDWPEDTVTGDYFGEFAKQIKEKLHAGDDFVGIMSNGTSGDVNIWDFMNPDRCPKEHFAKSKLVGGALSQEVIQELPNLQWQNNPSLAVLYEELELAVRKPSHYELEASKKAFIENDFNNLSIKVDALQRIYDREQLMLNESPDNFIAPLQIIKIGSLVIGALPGEFFSETGLNLKKSISSYNYFSISLANAYGGYIPPAHEMERGGYETWRARSSFLESGAEQKIREKLINMVKNFNVARP